MWLEAFEQSELFGCRLHQQNLQGQIFYWQKDETEGGMVAR